MKKTTRLVSIFAAALSDPFDGRMRRRGRILYNYHAGLFRQHRFHLRREHVW